jgi:hypothetical protein
VALKIGGSVNPGKIGREQPGGVSRQKKMLFIFDVIVLLKRFGNLFLAISKLANGQK